MRSNGEVNLFMRASRSFFSRSVPCRVGTVPPRNCASLPAAETNDDDAVEEWQRLHLAYQRITAHGTKLCRSLMKSRNAEVLWYCDEGTQKGGRRAPSIICFQLLCKMPTPCKRLPPWLFTIHLTIPWPDYLPGGGGKVASTCGFKLCLSLTASNANLMFHRCPDYPGSCARTSPALFALRQTRRAEYTLDSKPIYAI